MPRMIRHALLLAALLAAAPAFAEEAKADKKPGKETYAVFVTSRGKIAARLLPDQAPNAVKNFIELATARKEWTDPRANKLTKEPLYEGTLFHRVIPGFMIQGGDPYTRGQPMQADPSYGMRGPGYRFEDEGLKVGDRPFDQACQLAYANSGANTNGSQFFITEVSTPHLNPRRDSPQQPCNSKSGTCGYVHFGAGVCGCERVRAIAMAGNAQTRLEKVLIVHEKPSCD
jgi:peptidylprolyl isomerase/peptidyl-prolyl cis-trans isomerase A (cyclophilin A)